MANMARPEKSQLVLQSLLDDLLLHQKGRKIRWDERND